MKNTAIKDKAEFEARQGCFDFGAACRFVNDLVAEMKKSLAGWTKGFVRNISMPRPVTKAPEQMKIDFLSWMAVLIPA